MSKFLYVILFLCTACSQVCDDISKTITVENSRVSSNSSWDGNLIVLNHPLVEHHLSIIRNRNTKSSEFRSSLKEIAKLLIYEATKNLPTIAIDVETPLTKTTCRRIDPDKEVIVVSILRAGLGITTVAEDMIPYAVIQLLGMYRDEKTHKPMWYYNKLPAYFQNAADTMVYICDPMLATGGSACEAIKEYLKRGIKEKILHFCV
jgi:uracil phosphoribosyltransferase